MFSKVIVFGREWIGQIYMRFIGFHSLRTKRDENEKEASIGYEEEIKLLGFEENSENIIYIYTYYSNYKLTPLILCNFKFRKFILN